MQERKKKKIKDTLEIKYLLELFLKLKNELDTAVILV